MYKYMESGGMRMRGAAIAFVVFMLLSGVSAGGITIYWGQNAEEASLEETCASGNFEIVIVSYLMINGSTGNSDTPELNVAGHPTNSLNDDIKSCQNQYGVKVFLSLDGAVGSEAHAVFLASYLWENFLGGDSVSRPLGDAVLDGIDFGLYEASTEHWDDLAKAIYNSSACSGKVYLSAAPQCPYPDAWLGTALETGLFDYIWIQFFNNAPCEYANDASNLVTSWNNWIHSVHTVQNNGFYLGLPAAPNYTSTGGYIDPDILIADVLPQIKASSSIDYGGVTLWTKYWDEQTNYSSSIKGDVLMKPSDDKEVTLAST